MAATNTGAYSAAADLVDYILGITFEIWEEGGVDLIDQYYSADTVVYALDGITRGSKVMIDGTHAMLAAFPDRLLLGDDVIGEGDCNDGFSSHRVLSPMTNKGDCMFGPATGKDVRIMNMADRRFGDSGVGVCALRGDASLACRNRVGPCRDRRALSCLARWAVCVTHSGDYLGAAATGKPVFVMGVTHRRIIDSRIAVEWTVFDSLGVLSQLL